jgi:hypothetical protein
MSLECQRRGSAQAQQDQIEYPILTLPPEITSAIFVQCLNARVIPDPLAVPSISLAIYRS